MKYVNILMALVYMGAGVTVLLLPSDNPIIPNQYATLLGIILISYGAFRGYNTYKKYLS